MLYCKTLAAAYERDDKAQTHKDESDLLEMWHSILVVQAIDDDVETVRVRRHTMLGERRMTHIVRLSAVRASPCALLLTMVRSLDNIVGHVRCSPTAEASETIIKSDPSAGLT